MIEDKVKKIEPLLVLLGLFAVLAVGISVIHSFDVFWQLQSGRYMVETGAVIRQDTFTLASEVFRYEHCWLHDVVLYAIFLLGGYAGISIWKGCMVAIAVALLLLAARIRSSSWLSIMAVLPLTFLTAGGWLERPQLWTFLFFALFIVLLEYYRKTRRHTVYLLALVMVVWTNMHAGAVLGLAVMAAYLMGEIATNLVKEKKVNFQNWKPLFLCSLVVVVSGLVNPYSTDFLKTLVMAPGLGVTTSETGQVTGPVTQVFNMDWSPTSFAAEPMFYYLMGAVAILFVLTLKRLSFSDLFLLVGLALMGKSLIRHIPFFYFGCIAIMPYYLDGIGGSLRKLTPAKIHLVGRISLLCGFAYLFWIFYQPVYQLYGPFNAGLREWHYPIEATRFVEDNNLQANIYNTYDWGGYMAWRLFPRYKVFWDGRQDSEEMFRFGWDVMAGRPGWDKILEKFKVKTIVSRASTIDTGQKYPVLDHLIERRDWHLVFNSESSLVFVKEGSVPKEWLLRHSLPKERMDDTILSEARLMVGVNPNRYMAWWEMAQIYLKRKQYKEAFFALRQHLQRAPTPHPQARIYYERLAKKLEH